MVNALQQEETIRDLRRQIDGLSREDEQEVIFRETSARRGKEVLYRLADGEPVPMKLGLARRAIHMLDGRGQPKWTTNPDAAPKWKPGEVKCFMHPDAPEREVLSELGIPPVCETGNLRNGQAKLMHAKHCHKQEWSAYQEYLEGEKERANNERQDRQLEATLAIAGRAVEPRIKATAIVEPDVADVHPNTELPYDANGVAPRMCEKCGTAIEGKDTFAKARHMKVCPAKDGE